MKCWRIYRDGLKTNGMIPKIEELECIKRTNRTVTFDSGTQEISTQHFTYEFDKDIAIDTAIAQTKHNIRTLEIKLGWAEELLEQLKAEK